MHVFGGMLVLLCCAHQTEGRVYYMNSIQILQAITSVSLVTRNRRRKEKERKDSSDSLNGLAGNKKLTADYLALKWKYTRGISAL